MPGSDACDAPLLSPGGGGSVAPRILDRDGTFAQSRGRWSVSNTGSAHSSGSSGAPRQRRGAAAAPPAPARDDDAPAPAPPRRPPGAARCCCLSPGEPVSRRCWDDWYHSLSYTPTCILLLGVFVAYVLTIFFFAGLYLAVNAVGEYYNEKAAKEAATDDGLTVLLADKHADSTSFCGMDINTHMEALYFSLSTMSTIGYGSSDYYLGECWTPFILVLLQVFSAIVFSSLAIGLLFQRMSRGQKRGRTIVFSDVAVVRMVRGSWYWMFRVGELRKRHIIGAKVRVFCVRHERCPVAGHGGTEAGGGPGVELETVHFVSHPLPLVAPGDAGDSFEQCILMGLPHVVVHRMDARSPVLPPRPTWYDAGGVPHGGGAAPPKAASEAPTEATTWDDVVGDPAAASNLLAFATECMEDGTAGSAASPLPASRGGGADQPPQEEIVRFLHDRQIEIIVFLEGTCEVTGMTLQARHSYRAEDLAFHRTFAPCVFPAPAAGRGWWARGPAAGDRGGEADAPDGAALEIDFGRFHDLLPVPYDSPSCPYIPSSSLRSS